MLEFANPMNALWALLALPIVVLFILKVRLRRVPVSTLIFWNQLYDEKKPRSLWQRLRHWLSLLLQLAFLWFLVSALVDPLWSWQKQNQRRVVLIIDNSASMQAINDDGVSRLEEAKQAAKVLVRSLRDGDQMSIVTAGGVPNVVWGMTDHQRWLIDAVDAIESADAPADLERSVKLAKRLLTSMEGDADTIIITDGQATQLDSLAADDSIKWYGVGEPDDNLAITRYQVRRSLSDAVGYQVLIEVANFGETAAECRLELTLDENLVDVLPLKIPPGETVTRVVDHTSPEGGRLLAKLDVIDALEVDNQAVAILPTRTTIDVQLVSDGNLFLRGALQSIPLVAIQETFPPNLDSAVISESDDETATSPTEIVDNVNASGFAALAESLSGKEAIYIFDQWVPDEIPPGAVLIIDPQNSCNLFEVGDPIGDPIVGEVDADSPVTQHIRLDNVLFPDAKQLTFKGEFDGLILDPYESPLLARVRRVDGDILVLSCSLDKGDLPLRIAFPVLVKNIVEWFRGESGELRAAAAGGEVVTMPVPNSLANVSDSKASGSQSNAVDDQAKVSENGAGSDDRTKSDVDVVRVEEAIEAVQRPLQLQSPSGDLQPITNLDGTVTLGPLLQSGIWQLSKGASDERSQSEAEKSAGDKTEDETETEAEAGLEIACNLTSAEESDLLDMGDIPRAADELNTASLSGRSPWFYLTICATLLIACEWWLHNRRIIA